MTAFGWGEGAPDGAEALASRLRRLELDNDDLRAENARLKASVGQRQDEIMELGERVGRLHAELADARRAAEDARRTLVSGTLRWLLRRARAFARRTAG